MRFARYFPTISLLVLACPLFTHAVGIGKANAQNIVVLVNDEPITSYDVAQRQRWIARTSGYGDKLKAILTGDGIKERFRQMMIAANPKSQAEAQQVAERIKKQLVEDAKTRVLTDGSGGGRKTAIEALVEDKLKLQAAKKLEIKITDKEVEETLIQRMGTPPDGKKPDINIFYQQFEGDGINRKTIQEIIRAQLAWRDVIRKQYGPRIASLLAAIPDSQPKTSENDLEFDVRVLHLAIDGSADQKAVSARILEAENLKEKFSSCANLPKQAQLIADATVKVMDKATLASFPKDVQPLIAKAGEGQMTPPVLVGNAVESYAICRKGVIAKPNAQTEQKPDARQQEYDRFSRRYMQELRQSASIDYRGT
jgi:peptidyl-prolyl cis-trans isomerase SurA